MRLTTRAAKAGTLVLVAVGLGGAVLHALPEPVDHVVRPTVARDVDAWSMPLDGYVEPSGAKSDYAAALVDQPCLRKIGIDFPPPWATVSGLEARDDGTSDDPEAPSLSRSRPLGADAAADRGYHTASTKGANPDGWRSWGEDPERNAAFARADQEAVSKCFTTTYRELGTGDASGRQQQASRIALHLTAVAADAARREPDVVTAAVRWRACLAPQTTRALPEDPHGMPTGAMRQEFGLGGLALPVTDAERTLAEQDVACQESSGYRRALYDAEWTRLLHVTATDAAVLEAADGDQLAVDRTLDRTIERLAPKAPKGVD